MKRLLALFLTGAMLIGLAGCKGSAPRLEEPSFAPLAMTPGPTYTGYPGMNIKIDSLNRHEVEGKTTLVVVWDNGTNHGVTYGAAYTVERLDGEEWVSCAKQDALAFIAIGYELKAGRLKNESYDLTDTYDVSAPGTYRFKTDCHVYEGTEKSVKCELTAEFTVGNIKCPDDSKEAGTEVQYSAQYIRTNGYIIGGEEHTHQVAAEAQTVDDPFVGYCGNTQTTLYIGKKAYTFMAGHSVTLTDILLNLDYKPETVCRCLPEYTVDTEFGTGYGVNLTEAYARCEKGQANLTQEQIDQIAEIIEWAETTNCQYPSNS